MFEEQKSIKTYGIYSKTIICNLEMYLLIYYCTFSKWKNFIFVHRKLFVVSITSSSIPYLIIKLH